MSASKTEQVLAAIRMLLETIPDAVVERNSVLPEKVPAGGLIVLRDGDPGEPEQSLGWRARILSKLPGRRIGLRPRRVRTGSSVPTASTL